MSKWLQTFSKERCTCSCEAHLSVFVKLSWMYSTVYVCGDEMKLSLATHATYDFKHKYNTITCWGHGSLEHHHVKIMAVLSLLCCRLPPMLWECHAPNDSDINLIEWHQFPKAQVLSTIKAFVLIISTEPQSHMLCEECQHFLLLPFNFTVFIELLLLLFSWYE